MNVREASKVKNRLSTWYVESETTPGTEYIVHNKRNTVSHRKVWTCDCLDFTNRQFFRGGICKHIQAVQNFRTLQIAKESANKTVLAGGVKEIISTLMAGFAGSDGVTLWNLVSFLRGPDTVNSWRMKAKTTSVLRSKLGLAKGLVDSNSYDEPFGIEILRRYSGNVVGQYYEFHGALKAALLEKFGGSTVVTEHFSQHYGEALRSAFKLGYIK